MTEKVNATLKVFYTFNNTKCVARGGIVAAMPLAPGADVATVDLRTCAKAICSSSPELIGDQNVGYAIYSLDATEGIENDLYEGQGQLSWALQQPARLGKFVSGFVRPSLSGNVLEVRIKLSQVTQSSQQDFVTSMQNFERISMTLPTTFDYSNWHEYSRTSNIESEPAVTAGPRGRPPKQRAQVNTLQKVRELAGRQGPQDMSAQLKSARQHQVMQQRNARLIAQQAAATPANGAGSFMPNKPLLQKKGTPGSSEATLPGDPPSPPLPTPSSPPQMKTFAPPPPSAVARTNSLPTTQAASEVSQPSPALMRYTSAPSAEALAEQPDRGLKRKAAELNSGPNPKRSIHFSPSKAINAARNSIGAVQQLFKSKSPEGRTQTPMALSQDSLQIGLSNESRRINPAIPLTSAQLDPYRINASHIRTQQGLGPIPGQVSPAAAEPASGSECGQGFDAQLYRTLEDGNPVKFCYNCGNLQTRGNWRQLTRHGKKHNLCNACGVYWKTNGRMRPSTLWNKVRPKDEVSNAEFPATALNRAATQNGSEYNTPVSSDADQFDGMGVAQTSPIKAHESQSAQDHRRATRSSPVPPSQMLNFTSPARSGSARRSNLREARQRTPTRETLHEIHPNTPAPPSPSPASGKDMENMLALLATPMKQLSAKVGATPSPWKSLFESFTDMQHNGIDSPAKQKLDNFLEQLNADPNGTVNFDFEGLENFAMSPGDQQNFDSIASFLSSPSGMKIFTSSAGMETNSTPEDLEPPMTPSKMKALLQTPVKSAQRLPEHLEEGDSLFTPKRHNTRSQPNSVQRNLRSAGSIF